MADVRGNQGQTHGTRPHDQAEDAGPADNPVKVGGKASSTLPTDVSAGDRVDALYDLKGRLVTAHKAGTATLSNVSASTSSVTLLAANIARLGASLFNDSSAVCYVKFGATASSTSHTVQIQQYDYYEVPTGYTGVIDGVWANATGAMRVTEIT